MEVDEEDMLENDENVITKTNELASSSLQDQNDAETRVFQLPGGGFHVCAGRACPHVSVCINATEKEYVCNLAGIVVAKTMETAGDSGWTGRSVASADPDQTSGGVSSSAWRAKRDAFLTSQNAWSRAKVISIDDIVSDDEDAPGGASLGRAPAYTTDAHSKPTKQSKRGAPCVVDTSDAATREMRREKSTRRLQSFTDSSTMERLRKDAASVVCKLLSVPVELESSLGAASSSSASSASTTAAGTDAASLEDPRLQNYDFVFMVGLRRYMARCHAENTVPSLDTLNNIAITASNFVRERKRAAKKKREGGPNPAVVRSVIHSGQCIDHTAALICALWTACCETPAFRDAQFGDSFKPFASGVLYAMKNGIAMTDMQKEEFELIPQIRLFSDQLPTLKTSASNQAARQLQSSSHKGMCAIHRAIASLNDIKDTSAKEAIMMRFKQAARVGFRVLEYVLTQVSVLSSQRQG